MTTTCVQCHAPSNGQFLDATCTAQLKTWLIELAGHAADLSETVVTRQTSRRGARVQVRGDTETPLPYDEDASTAAETLRSTLVSIVRDLCEQRGIVYPSVDTSQAMAAWLARNVMCIALSPDALETWGDVESLAVGYMSVNDEGKDVWKRSIVLCAVDIAPTKVWLGRCDAIVDGRTCAQDVRAATDAIAVKCSGCMTTHVIAEFKVRVLAAAGGELATGPQLVRYLGGRRIIKTQNRWKARERVKVHGEQDGHDLFKVEEILSAMADKGRHRAA